MGKRVDEVFTSESVTEGHPDKMCDQISDALVDEVLKKDPMARTAIETTASNGIIYVFGEISTLHELDVERIVRKKVREIGYREKDLSVDGKGYEVLLNLNQQSPDIAQGVVGGSEIGAGDQGMMFGYACSETKEKMPLPAILSHKLCKRLAEVRKDGTIPYLKPDGKAQVSAGYYKKELVRVETVLVSTQHEEGVELEQIKKDLVRKVIIPVLGDYFEEGETRVLVNPTGRFVLGGPAADAGLTGRKIIVDTYGSKGRHGGGAFSGKDATKVDRSGAYLARYLAKNVVAAGLGKECEVQIAYSIGIATPVSFRVDTFGSGKVDDRIIADVLMDMVDLRPESIINKFGLRRPIFQQFASYGHFGRGVMFLKGSKLSTPWEEEDIADEIKKRVSVALIKDSWDKAEEVV